MFKRIINVIWLSGITLSAAVGAPASVAEKPPIPEDLYFEFKPVPVEQNAIINWRRAAELEVAPNQKEQQILKFCWTPAAREPAGEDLGDLQNWLKRNQEGLALFESSLSKPKAQWPEHNAQDKQPEMAALSYFGKARLFAADQMAEAGNLEAAAKLLEGNLKLVQMGIEGSPALIKYGIACNVRALTQDAILRLAARKKTPLPILERLLDNLPSLDVETNLYSKVLRVEFTRDYNAKIDVKKMAEDWSKLLQTNMALMLFPEDCERPLKVLLDPSLVAFHPKPYDLNADLEESARHYRIYRTNLYCAWSERSSEVEREHEASQSNLLQDIAPLMKQVENEPLPLSRAAAQRARAAYVELENPIGRILDCSTISFMCSDVKVFHSRTERQATRAVLALLIFERRKGVLPGKLSDVVDEKILKSVPNDPMSGEKILYSRERRVVWSAGEDSADDGGSAGELRWFGKDAVWQIPELR